MPPTTCLGMDVPTDELERAKQEKFFKSKSPAITPIERDYRMSEDFGLWCMHIHPKCRTSEKNGT